MNCWHAAIYARSLWRLSLSGGARIQILAGGFDRTSWRLLIIRVCRHKGTRIHSRRLFVTALGGLSRMLNAFADAVDQRTKRFDSCHKPELQLYTDYLLRFALRE